MDNLKDILTQKAIEKVESEREGQKPDFNDLGIEEALGRLKRVIRGGKSKRVKQGQTVAQKMKNTGLNKLKTKLKAIKTQKSKKRSGANTGGKKKRADAKRKRSMRKRGGK